MDVTLSAREVAQTVRQVWDDHEGTIREAMAVADELERLVLGRELADAQWLRAELFRRLDLTRAGDGGER